MTSKHYYLVAGLGQTGYSIAAFLKRRNHDFIMFDTRANPESYADFKTHFADIDVFLVTLPKAVYPLIHTVIASPGVNFNDDFWQKIKQYHIEVIGDVECLAKEITAPVVAITGTNGKSTVTMLVAEIAKAQGMRVAVAGNIGTPVLNLLDDNHHYDLWVIELSSFQLDLTYNLMPVAATILNISPDHLDRHKNMDNYRASKQRIYRHARTCLYNRQDTVTYPDNLTNTAVNLISFGIEIPMTDVLSQSWGLTIHQGKTYLAQGNELVINVDNLLIKGQHNWQNALAACALASAIGLDRASMILALTTFTGLNHRCQWVRSLNEVTWINDSKGTNIGATLAALSGIGQHLTGRIILIAGGVGKGADFTQLTATIGNYCRSVILIGQDADKINQALHDIVPVYFAMSMSQAVVLAKNQARAGDIVLLSPACASQDMFRDFNHRGECFMTLVSAL